MLLLSAATSQALTSMSTAYAAYLRKNPSRRGALIHTASKRRERLKTASYSLIDGSTILDPAPPVQGQSVHEVAFVFTGQGAQWVGMGRQMMLENRDFAASIRSMDDTLQKLEHRVNWTLEKTLLDCELEAGILNSADRAHPACTAIQVAYVDTLAACNVKPSAVVGHSSGELAAAYAAGILTRQEAITLAFYRGHACAQSSTPGSMAAIGMGSDAIAPFLKSGVVVACENSDASVTLSGSEQELDDSLKSIKATFPDAFVRKLRVAMAYHSPHMQSSAALYNALITPHFIPKQPRVPFYSTVHGRKVLEGKVFGPQYWQLGIESQVCFRAAVTKLLQDSGKSTGLLEIGPHSALSGPLRQICKEIGHNAPYASVAERSQDSSVVFLQSLGKLFSLGLTPDIPGADQAVVLGDLPTYPWDRETSYWAETRMMKDWRFRTHSKHELLGHRSLESSDVEPMWRNFIKLGEIAWLADHCVGKDIVFPAAGYLAMAGTAIAQLTGSTAYTVQDVNIATAMLLTENKATEVVTTCRKHFWTSTNESKWWEFSIASVTGDTWTKHCWGLVTAGCATARPAPDVTSYVRKVPSPRWYTALARIGLNYGPRFIGMENITASPVADSAALSITDRQHGRDSYALHPSTIDLVLQSWSVASTRGEFSKLDRLFLPTFIEQFYIADNHGKTLNVHTASLGLPGTALADSYGVADGEVAFVLQGFRGTRMESLTGSESSDQPILTFQWHPEIASAAVENLIRPTRPTPDLVKSVERFGALIACEIWHEASTIDSYAQPYFSHYIKGIQEQMDEIEAGKSFVPDAGEIKAMTREERRAQIESFHKQTLGGPASGSTEALWRVYTNIRDILTGEKVFLDVLLVDDVLTQFYNESNSLSDVTDFFRLLGLNKPQLRVLEIGAGTGGTTAAVLKALHSPTGERLYGSYTITDISAGFVNRCKERFQEYQSLKYAVLDISGDPSEQGFEAGSFDLILGSNVRLNAYHQANDCIY